MVIQLEVAERARLFEGALEESEEQMSGMSRVTVAVLDPVML